MATNKYTLLRRHSPALLPWAASFFGALTVSLSAEEGVSVSPYRNGFRFGPNLAFNIKTSFRDVSVRNPGTVAGTAEERIYDDGYIRVDRGGNANGESWFWGVNNPAQIANPTSVIFAAISNPGSGVQRSGDNAHPGFELAYDRPLTGGDMWALGGTFSFGFNELRVDDRRTISGNATKISDTFSLGGLFVTPDYQGTFNGPGPVITSAPTLGRTVTTVPATVTGYRKFYGELYAFRVGPYLDLAMASRITLSLEGGAALALAKSDLEVKETLVSGGATIRQIGGESSETSIVVGGYAGARFEYKVLESVGVYTGAQFQSMGGLSQEVSGKSAKMDLGKTIFLSLGMRIRF